jgi:hypothetical protein
MLHRLHRILKTHFEAIVWIAALLFLFFLVPGASHFSLCPLANLGLDFCPGCGIGRSIHHAMWLDFAGSFASHPLGIMALLIIIYRIIQLLIKSHKTLKT